MLAPALREDRGRYQPSRPIGPRPQELEVPCLEKQVRTSPNRARMAVCYQVCDGEQMPPHDPSPSPRDRLTATLAAFQLPLRTASPSAAEAQSEARDLRHRSR